MSRRKREEQAEKLAQDQQNNEIAYAVVVGMKRVGENALKPFINYIKADITHIPLLRDILDEHCKDNAYEIHKSIINDAKAALLNRKEGGVNGDGSQGAKSIAGSATAGSEKDGGAGD